jgi:integrase
MATIVKQRGKWRAQIRRAGVSLSKSFPTKNDAVIWAKLTERELALRVERGSSEGVSPGLEPGVGDAPQAEPNGMTLGGLITTYRDTVTPKKRGRAQETHSLNAFLRHPICSLELSKVKTGHFAAYRDERLRTVKPITLKRQLSIIHNAFEIARDEWDIAIPSNPLDKLRLKAMVTQRDRRLKDGELEKIIEAAGKCKNLLVLPVILFAIETGMRRGEIFAMRWENLDSESSCLHIPKTKNGYARDIPLTDRAWTILEGLWRRTSGPVFLIKVNCFRIAWTRIKNTLGIDLRFHDLRH